MSPHVVIIGNGITGVTAARFVRKLSDYRITIISDETDHFYSRPALMYIYMGHMRYRETKPYEDNFWSKNRIELLRGHATRIDAEAKHLYLGGRELPLSYDMLLLATGSQSNFFGWPGQDLEGVQGMYGIPDLATMERWTKDIQHAVVVGGGLIGIEMAEMLYSRDIPVTFLVRERTYMDRLLPEEESSIVNREILHHGIDLRLGTELKAILSDDTGRVRAVETSALDEVPCQFVGLTTGVHPNTDLARVSGVGTNRGILVNEFFETNMPDVYAAGDCCEFTRDGIGSRRTEQLWYTGRQHGKTVAHIICGLRKPYDRGVFYNSAKFFTVEYQTYGDITPVPEPGIETILWQDGHRLLRINYAENDRRVVGFNLFGIRFRHDRCEHWILEKTPVDTVVSELRKAQFDAEFTRSLQPPHLTAKSID